MKRVAVLIFVFLVLAVYVECGVLITAKGKKLEGHIIKRDSVYTLKTNDNRLYQFDESEVRDVENIDEDFTVKDIKEERVEEIVKIVEKPELPEVLMTTTEGEIRMVLFEDDAPNTVANFISLVQNSFYNNTLFHRIVPGFVAQVGDPNTKGERGKDFILHEDLAQLQSEGKPVPNLPIAGTGGPGYMIKAEFNSNRHLRGTLAMARSTEIDSAGSQIYICFAPQPRLDGNYTTFGKVLTGMETVDKLTNSSRIIDIKILKKRNHDYLTEKIDRR